jgi:hypothetical protein
MTYTRRRGIRDVDGVVVRTHPDDKFGATN